MNRMFTVCALLAGLTAAYATGLQGPAERPSSSLAKSRREAARTPDQSPYQCQGTWYEFMLKQFNPDDFNYGNWVEQQRRRFIEGAAKNPYFLYSLSTTLALLIATMACVKLRIDHRRAMWITAEMMADLYNQDAYSRQVAREAIERYNKHIEACNRAIETGESNAATAAGTAEIEQLRAELMRMAEERDTAIRDRDIARDDLRRKSEILAEMSVCLDGVTNKSTVQDSAKAALDARTNDARLVSHINNLQEQLYVQRKNNHRLKGT